MAPCRAALALFACSMATAAAAQSYPARPVRLVVGFAAGGATDLSARTVAQKLSETLGQQVVVDNRVGASGNLAGEIVARSAPDGYTLYLANATAAMPSLFSKVPFDIRKDFTPVSLVGYGPLLLTTHPSLPVKSVKELIALAKRRPGSLNYGSAGIGSMNHLCMALLISMTQVDMVHIPYKGGAPSSIGILTGEAQLMFASVAASLPQVKANRLRPLAVSAARRSAALPDVPTVSEAGLTGYDANSWYAILAPAGTPRPVLLKLSEEAVRSLAAADLRERLVTQGVEPAAGGVEEFAPYLAQEIPKWEKLIKDAGIPPQ